MPGFFWCCAGIGDLGSSSLPLTLLPRRAIAVRLFFGVVVFVDFIFFRVAMASIQPFRVGKVLMRTTQGGALRALPRAIKMQPLQLLTTSFLLPTFLLFFL